MRKLWLTFTAMLFCSIASFAQITPVQPNEGNGTAGNPYKIDTPAEFMWINSDNDAHYELTANLNLGTYHADNNNFVIASFSGTFNGNNKTITYEAGFEGTAAGTYYGLFKQLTGVIEYLNLFANITLSGTYNDMNVGLLCGEIENDGKVRFCNVTGNLNSTVDASSGGTDAGLVAGQCLGEIFYCIVSGNVTGVGYVGGIVGALGDIWNGNPGGTIKACSFTGTVNAVSPSNTQGGAKGSFGGGICGQADNNASFDFCVVDADIVGLKDGNGITCSSKVTWGGLSQSTQGGTAGVTHCYGEGTINGDAIDSDTDLANNSGVSGTTNYFEGENTPANIVQALNDANTDVNFHFEVINGKVTLVIGQQQTFICESPINLSVVNNNGIVTVSWDVNDQDSSVEETTFRCTMINGDEINTITTTEREFEGELEPSPNPYTFTVESDCSASSNGLYSDAVTTTFYVNENCTTVTALTASDVTASSANITWQGDAEEVKLNGEAVIFANGQTLALTNLSPAMTYTVEAIVYCTENGEIVDTLSTSITFKTHGLGYVTKQSGDFNSRETWEGNEVPTGDLADIIINTGHKVFVYHDLVITDQYKIIENRGVLQITQQGQLINKTTTNVPGIIEIESSPKANQAWTFIGAPFQTGYKLETILPVPAPGNDADGISDISVKKYDYNKKDDNGNDAPGWSDSWAHIGTDMKAGEGYFGYPFYGGVVTFTTYGDVCTWDNTNGRYVMGSYNFDSIPVTALNNGDVIVEESIAQSNDGYWMALSNPYPAKLSVKAFVDANDPVGGTEIIQGRCVYVFRNGTFDMNSGQSGTQGLSSGNIEMAEGFFVNFKADAEKKVTFTKNQLSYNATAKASANEFIELTLINGDKKVRAYLAHNEEAEQGYDIFDANKLFAPTEIAEPYFITDGIALMKEEFAELPYYATMNVRSFANDTVSFVVNNIPEGLAVSIIDGENVIDMVEGGVYTTEILTGENADRFKVLIKKNVGIADVEELEVNITNNNRHISIATTETDLQVEVYNALGQKVLSTKDRNFTLNQVSAGAYLIKAFNNKASKTQKIVVE